MPYSVSQLAKLSGISIRTLRWYDEKGLLKPSYHGANGYRYYDEEKLLTLQQILFFRELGFSLADIDKLLTHDDFNQIRGLQAHKKIIKEEIKRKRNLITTIDKTIQRLRGKQIMTDKELYDGFDRDRQKEYEQYIVKEHGLKGEKLLKQSRKTTKQWSHDEWLDVKNCGDQIHKDLAKAIDQKLDPESDQVQAIIHRHYTLQSSFFNMTKEVYLGLTELYADHPDFKNYFDEYHPDMIEYLGKAMICYAENNL